MSKRNVTAIVLGFLLFVGGVVGFLVFAQLINPPTTEVVVAVVDIPAGTKLTEQMLAVDNVHVNSKVLSAIVRQSEMSQFVGSTVVEPIGQYQFVPKSALATDGNPASDRRVALALSDPSLVAMVVPVSPETAPDSIVEGDHVDLSFGVPSNTNFGDPMEKNATPVAFSGQFLQSDLTTPEPLAGTPPASPTAPAPLLMPVAKTIVSYAKVLALIHEQNQVASGNSISSSGSQNGADVVVVPGKLIGLVVAVPRQAQEVVQFAIDNGVVRVSVLSAAVQPGDTHQPTLGMTWNDLVALMSMDRQQALANGLPTEMYGPGAAAIQATLQPTPENTTTANPSSTRGAAVSPTQLPTQLSKRP
jgi:hypothetical protein